MLAEIIVFIYKVLMQALRLYSFIWFIWIIISWLTAFGAIHLDYYNPIVNFFYKITDGVIEKIEYIVYFYIILCPILDIASYCFRNAFDTSISISTFLRPIIPIILAIYIFIKDCCIEKLL